MQSGNGTACCVRRPRLLTWRSSAWQRPRPWSPRSLRPPAPQSRAPMRTSQRRLVSPSPLACSRPSSPRTPGPPCATYASRSPRRLSSRHILNILNAFSLLTPFKPLHLLGPHATYTSRSPRRLLFSRGPFETAAAAKGVCALLLFQRLAARMGHLLGCPSQRRSSTLLEALVCRCLFSSTPRALMHSKGLFTVLLRHNKCLCIYAACPGLLCTARNPLQCLHAQQVALR
mmetsp:Transcript_22973/g.63457  ORF Transcript_22973/g.63457 Transcript_22973/m.63457 type:complete len:230 (-) Transcript_22973:336-1025(-)